MEKYNLENDTLSESEIQRLYNYRIYPRDSKQYSYKYFVNIENGTIGGSHWTDFYVKNIRSFFFDCFGESVVKFILNQLLKTNKYHKNKYQIFNRNFCGTYCLYFFYLYLIERMNY